MSRSTPSAALTPIRLALAGAAAVWIGLRLLAPTSPPPKAAVRALDAVEAVPSLDTGRIELLGWPEAVEQLDIADIPEVAAAATRLEARIGHANEALARLASDITARIEVFPEGPVGLRLAGLLVVFPSADGAELASLAEPDPERPWETLRRLARLLETRLEEPPDMTRLEDSVQRRELTRTSHEVADAIREQEQEANGAVEIFRAESLDAIRAGGGPFLRRGRGLAIETVLAALFAALLREAVRPRSRMDPVLTAAVAPVIALATVIGLAGTRWLPAHPVMGLTPAFVAVAFVMGWATPGILGAMAHLERRGKPEAEGPGPVEVPPLRPGAPNRSVEEAPPAPTPPPPTARPAPNAPPPDGTAPPGERPPFFPRRR